MGTDDGNLQLTTDGGKNWSNLIKNVSGVGANSPVSHVEPSRTNASTAYVSFDRHMFDDFKPYIFKTTDGGKSWTNISGNLPAKAYVQVVREDRRTRTCSTRAPNSVCLLRTTAAKTGFVESEEPPNVAIHDILVHPRENDLILATHGAASGSSTMRA